MTPGIRIFVIFILFMLLIIANYFVYRRFLLKIHFKQLKIAKHLIKLIPIILIIFHAIFIVGVAVKVEMFPTSIFFASGISVAILLFLFIIALIYDLLFTIGKKIPFNHSRRKFIKIAFDVTALILAFSYLIRGLWEGNKKPIINRVNIAIKNFEFDSFRIAQLTDLHAGKTIKKEFIKECVDRICALNVDMVVITGDLVDMPINEIKDDLTYLANLKSRFGTYYVLGNHEYMHGALEIVNHIKTLNIRVLLNESVKIGDTKGSYFNLVGINDIASKHFNELLVDVPKAFSNCNIHKSTIVLAHQPKAVKQMQNENYDLMLSGHTHGGQIFPLGLILLLDQPYLAGYYKIDDKKQIFVSRGAGYWGPAVRVFAPSEISLIKVVRTT